MEKAEPAEVAGMKNEISTRVDGCKWRLPYGGLT
jgi:hypothetical protein